jgi:hypothetical protein
LVATLFGPVPFPILICVKSTQPHTISGLTTYHAITGLALALLPLLLFGHAVTILAVTRTFLPLIVIMLRAALTALPYPLATTETKT